MSSLKDIMDVDVEPLESQAYRRERAAQQQASRPSLDPSSQSPSPQLDDTRGKSSDSRRRSNRVSKSATQSTTSRPTITRRRSSATGEPMDFSSAYQVGGPGQGAMGSPLQTSSRGGMDTMSDMPVKYTPVTGRISRAKKGVPVHTCEECKPAKTFTRAEHLRRHKLSHSKPAYPCTFEDCERNFHRPDLLARHLNRHETQGEKAYRSNDPRSRASSSASESQPMKLESAPHGVTSLSQMSPNDSLTARTSGSGESAVTSTSFNSLNNFPSVNYSQGGSQKRSTNQSNMTDADVYSPTTVGAASRTSTSFHDMTTSFPVQPMSELSSQDTYRGSSSSFGLYSNDSGAFPTYSAPPDLPLLRIPEDSFDPGLSYPDNSPWGSSASDSTYSTHSDSSHTGRVAHRGRSGSLVTAPEWSAVSVNSQWSPHGMTNTPQDLRSPPYETTMMEAFGETTYTPPRMSPPSRDLLDVPFHGAYYMEAVGNPHPSTTHKQITQTFPASASSPRISNSRLASFDRRSKDQLVDTQQLGILTNIGAIMSSPTNSAIQNFDLYLSGYWNNFDKLYPIVHRPTYMQHSNDLLTFAMAAIGTQYYHNAEARNHGVELHAYCIKTISFIPNWDLQTLQAILLTEIFTCFRGKKTTIRLSRQFEELYNRLLNTSHQIPETSNTSKPPTQPSTPAPDFQSTWLHWISTESRQRLLSLCFIFDTQQSLYHQNPRSQPHVNTSTTLLYTPCSRSAWECSCAEEWTEISTSSIRAQPLHLLLQTLTTQEKISQDQDLDPFSRALLITSLSIHLLPSSCAETPTSNDLQVVQPDSQNEQTITLLSTLFPSSPLASAYLSFAHTPLRDLLAVTGDTWVFSKKLTSQLAFKAAKDRLRSWSSTLAGATATHHACIFLLSSLSLSSPEEEDISRFDLAHYWAIDICTLICWAFGHRLENPPLAIPSTTSASSSSSFSSSSIPTTETQTLALTYLQNMSALPIPALLTSKARMRGQTQALLAVVMKRLMMEGVGNRCMTLVDCVGVLGRIGEGGRGKWF